MPAFPEGRSACGIRPGAGAGARLGGKLGVKLCLAFALDSLLGDPPAPWHPVIWMGKVIELADWGMPGRETGPVGERMAGIAVAAVLPAGAYVVTGGFLRSLPRPLRGAAEVALLSLSLAGRSLYQKAGDAQRGLAKNLEEGRRQVSHLVGRDTAGLDEEGVTRAAIESVAENCNDGVVAPIFYGLVGGAPMAIAYRMINTLDSMIGYRNMRYGSFGWASARLDDAAGFVPARITALAAALASPAVGGSISGSFRVSHQDGPKHDSPNAGICEGAFAGALGVRLGGTNYYDGVPVEMPAMGTGLQNPEWNDISRAANLMYATGALALAAGVIARRLWPGWRRQANGRLPGGGNR